VIACSIPFLEVSQEVSLIIYGVVALLCIVVLWRLAATHHPEEHVETPISARLPAKTSRPARLVASAARRR
jgi:hypothetical protein